MEYKKAEKELLDESFLKNLHSSTFDFIVDGDDFRIDGGYFAQEGDSLFGYILYRELSKSNIELVYGGVDRSMRGFKTVKALSEFLEMLGEKYSKITTMVLSKNHKMLKIYMALGFDIVGTKLSNDNHILVILNKKR